MEGGDMMIINDLPRWGEGVAKCRKTSLTYADTYNWQVTVSSGDVWMEASLRNWVFLSSNISSVLFNYQYFICFNKYEFKKWDTIPPNPEYLL